MYKEILDIWYVHDFLEEPDKGAVSLHNRVFLLVNLVFFYHISWEGNNQLHIVEVLRI